MTELTLTLKIKPKFTLDMSPLIPDQLQGMNQASIKKLNLVYGKETVAVGDLFKVEGRNAEDIIIAKGCEFLVCVGKNMSTGTITVKGDTGDLLGQSMRGGKIIVRGNAGSWPGSAMTGGRIDIHGNAGDYVGAGIPGDPFGMNKGLINILGNAGDRIGDRMRRGIIIVHGKAGNYCGSRMHAGTIIVLDKIGQYPGNAMRRGTIILAKKPAHVAATFKSCGNLKMQFLRLFFTQLADMGKDFAFFKEYGPVAHRFSGDLARNGKGEILILQTLNSR